MMRIIDDSFIVMALLFPKHLIAVYIFELLSRYSTLTSETIFPEIYERLSRGADMTTSKSKRHTAKNKPIKFLTEHRRRVRVYGQRVSISCNFESSTWGKPWIWVYNLQYKKKAKKLFKFNVYYIFISGKCLRHCCILLYSCGAASLKTLVLISWYTHYLSESDNWRTCLCTGILASSLLSISIFDSYP